MFQDQYIWYYNGNSWNDLQTGGYLPNDQIWDETGLSGLDINKKGILSVFGWDNRTSDKEFFDINGQMVEQVALWAKSLSHMDNPDNQAPHDGFYYVLPYLGIQELLCLEQVCKPLCDAVRRDPSLFRNLRVEHPLSDRLTDDALLRLSGRAEGRLNSLVLINCPKISDNAVHEVVVTNRLLKKLHLPGCKRITTDAVVRMVQHYSEVGGEGLQELRIRGLQGTTKEHLQILKEAIFPSSKQKVTQPPTLKPQYYHYGQFTEDDRLIDMDLCPLCQKPRLVYDCTRVKCQQRQALEHKCCRGCISCISRCEKCGICIEGVDYEESFSLDTICCECWETPIKCKECSKPGGLSGKDICRSGVEFICGDCRPTGYKLIVV